MTTEHPLDALEENASPVYVPSVHGDRWVDPKGYTKWRTLRNIRTRLDKVRKLLADCHVDFFKMAMTDEANDCTDMSKLACALRTVCDENSATLVETQKLQADERASAYLHLVNKKDPEA